jgi:hypothetical protein
MLKINQVTANAKQNHTLVLPDGTNLQIRIYFAQQQKSWFIEQLVYGDFEVRGMRLSNSYNLLYQYKNKIPFGLACLSKEQREPSLQEDFSSGNSILYILTAAEVSQYTEFLSG